MVSSLKAALGNFYISDRRFCQSFKLALASCVLDERESGEELSLGPAHLFATSFGLIITNRREHTDAFDNCYSTIVGTYASDIDVIQKLQKVARFIADLEEDYDDSLSAAESARMYV